MVKNRVVHNKPIKATKQFFKAKKQPKRTIDPELGYIDLSKKKK